MANRPNKAWIQTYYKSASWCSYFCIILICLLQLNNSKICLFWDHTAVVEYPKLMSTNYRGTPHNTNSQLHTGNILFIITHCCSSADAAEPLGERQTATDKAINIFLNNKQDININAARQHFHLTYFIGKRRVVHYCHNTMLDLLSVWSHTSPWWTASFFCELWSQTGCQGGTFKLWYLFQ